MSADSHLIKIQLTETSADPEAAGSRRGSFDKGAGSSQRCTPTQRRPSSIQWEHVFLMDDDGRLSVAETMEDEEVGDESEPHPGPDSEPLAYAEHLSEAEQPDIIITGSATSSSSLLHSGALPLRPPSVVALLGCADRLAAPDSNPRREGSSNLAAWATQIDTAWATRINSGPNANAMERCSSPQIASAPPDGRRSPPGPAAAAVTAVNVCSADHNGFANHHGSHPNRSTGKVSVRGDDGEAVDCDIADVPGAALTSDIARLTTNEAQRCSSAHVDSDTSVSRSPAQVGSQTGPSQVCALEPASRQQHADAARQECAVSDGRAESGGGHGALSAEAVSQAVQRLQQRQQQERAASRAARHPLSPYQHQFPGPRLGAEHAAGSGAGGGPLPRARAISQQHANVYGPPPSMPQNPHQQLHQQLHQQQQQLWGMLPHVSKPRALSGPSQGPQRAGAGVLGEGSDGGAGGGSDSAYGSRGSGQYPSWLHPGSPVQRSAGDGGGSMPGGEDGGEGWLVGVPVLDAAAASPGLGTGVGMGMADAIAAGAGSPFLSLGGSGTRSGGVGRAENQPQRTWCEASDRLQALAHTVHSVASGDEATRSYLQQLLLPDTGASTASQELTYSGTYNGSMNSALLRAYGSTGGHPMATGSSGGRTAGRRAGTSSGAAHEGTPYASAVAAAAAAASVGRAHSAAHGFSLSGALNSEAALYGAGSVASPMLGTYGTDWQSQPGSADWTALLATGASGSGGRVHSSMLPASPVGARTSSATGRGSTQHTADGSDGSTAAAAAAAEEALYADKSVEALIAQLRGLYDKQPSGSSTAAAAAAATTGGDDAAAPEAAAAAAEALTAERGAVVAALWRLVRSRDQDATNYLLNLDPASRAHRPYADVLKEMRRWVFVQLW